MAQLKLLNLRDNTSTFFPFDRAAASLTWSADGRYVYFIAQSNGGAPIYRLDPATKKIEQLFDYSTGTTGFDIQNDRLLFGRTEPLDPSELYRANAAGGQATVISAFNSDWLKTRDLSLPEHHMFKNSLGETIDYWG